MAVNKVIYNNRTIVDMTDATASASNILFPYQAYLSTGVLTMGTAGDEQIVTRTETANATGITCNLTTSNSDALSLTDAEAASLLALFT